MATDSLFGNRIQEACIYCEYSYPSGRDDALLCFKKGIVKTDHSCSKFRYDPLMRVPRLPRELETFSDGDFTL